MARVAKRAPVVSDVPTDFESPESSSIAGACYDAVTETMRLRIKERSTYYPDVPGADPFTAIREKVYRYDKFPLSAWVEFFQADSKGKHFAARIRPFYTGQLES